MTGPHLSCKRFKDLIATPALPELGPKPRAGRRALAELNQLLDRFIAEADLPNAIIPLARSAALLWHDYLDESHAISQSIDTADGSFLHGIMHRREPDYRNAKYWFHRVGQHACFPAIAGEVMRRLEIKRETELASRLAPRGHWDPFAFVDACEEAANLAPSIQRLQILKVIQEIEFDRLLEHLLAS